MPPMAGKKEKQEAFLPNSLTTPRTMRVSLGLTTLWSAQVREWVLIRLLSASTTTITLSPRDEEEGHEEVDGSIADEEAICVTHSILYSGRCMGSESVIIGRQERKWKRICLGEALPTIRLIVRNKKVSLNKRTNLGPIDGYYIAFHNPLNLERKKLLGLMLNTSVLQLQMRITT